MRKYLLLTLIFICFGLSAAVREAGVSAELARERHDRIARPVYELRFDIPDNVAEDVTGSLKLSFNYTPAGGELALDFLPGADKLGKVKVNGKLFGAAEGLSVEKEHIFIPDRALKKGKNSIEISFTADSRHLNRRDDYLYTLFVPDHARSVFPCFDQPDIKGEFRLTLTVPESWHAVGNSKVAKEKRLKDGRREVRFLPTEPLSTYLFAFAAGNFKYDEFIAPEGRKIGAFHRETDPKRVAQLPQVIAEVEQALLWQERFTDRAYPFAKYDIVVLPGFQFGGMEHTGATFYNDNSIFLGENPTPEERLRRSQLIAHETSHMWFGDYVTMKWFNEVWVKEVFANYFAAAITREALPEYDHDITWLRSYLAAALYDDRTDGRTPIEQELGNMRDAGLIYNSIIYNKAPVVMRKLVELIGEDAYRAGIREYIEKFGYSNADWPDLRECLQNHTDFPVREFCRVWVEEAGMPEIHAKISDGKLIVTQREAFSGDSVGNGNLWPQKFNVRIALPDGNEFEKSVTMTSERAEERIPLPDLVRNPLLRGSDYMLIPNSDGKGYGIFTTDTASQSRLLHAVASDSLPALTPAGKLAFWMNLHENWLAKRIGDREWVECLVGTIGKEKEPQTASMLAGYLGGTLSYLSDSLKREVEREMLTLMDTHPVASCRTALLRNLIYNATSPAACERMLSIWEEGKSPLLNENDFMRMAYELAIRYPERWEEIISTQRGRLENPDRVARFDFISPAVNPDGKERDKVFARLLTPEGRQIEPWAETALSLLNHPLRQKESLKYIRPALEELPEVQRTGDIFFPAGWCESLLDSHRSAEAMAEVDAYLSAHPELNPLLRNKLLTAVYPLRRAARK